MVEREVKNKRDPLPDKGVEHRILITLFQTKRAGQIASKEMLKEAIVDSPKHDRG